MRINGLRTERRSGLVLLAVLMVTVLLTLAAYHYSDWMLAELQASDSAARAAQARAFADSGIHYAAALLADPGYFAAGGEGGNPYDNPQIFHGVTVRPDDAPKHLGRFSLIAPAPAGQGLRHGVIDEGGKINLNALLQFDSSGQVAANMLMKLPGMTEEIAAAILDWIDTDETARAGGAESDYYSGLNPPYLAKNGPIESIDELLLIRGITPELLYGDDLNRNGILDAEEAGELGLGWSAYLTFYGREQNLDSAGLPRIYVNDSDLQGLFDKLQAAVGLELANYILAYRIYGPASGSNQKGSGGGGARSAGSMPSGQLNFRRGRPRNLSSLFELINTTVSIPGANANDPPTIYASPLSGAGALRQHLPNLLDKVTTVRDAEIPGRININTAPEAVLRALPGLNDADVQSILNRRPQIAAGQALDPIYQSPAWLVTEANLSVSAARALEKYVTTRSQVYRVHVVGYFENGGPSARLEAVVDTNSGRPRIIYWRDLTELGRGYDAQGLNR